MATQVPLKRARCEGTLCIPDHDLCLAALNPFTSFQECVTSSSLDPFFFQLASQRLAMAIMPLLATRLPIKAKSLTEGLP